MIISDNKRGGLTNKEALRIFIKKFDEFMEKIHSFIPSKQCKINLIHILDYVFIFYLIIIAISDGIKIRLYHDSRDNELTLLVTNILIILIYFATAITHKIIKKKKITKNLLDLREEIIEMINKCNDTSSPYYTNLEEYEGNFYYSYDNSFIKTLRNQEWVRIPKNVIVEGDYIKLNVGDNSPADVRCSDYRYKPNKWDFCLKKGEVFKGFQESSSLDSQIEFFMENKYDDLFKTKDEWVFEVINDPFLDTLEIYVKNYYYKSNKSQNAKLYKISITKEAKLLKSLLFLFNLLLILTMLFWIFYNLSLSDLLHIETSTKCLKIYFYIMNHPLFFFTAFIYIYFEMIIKFLLYWGNACIYILKKNIFPQIDLETKKKIKINEDPERKKNLPQIIENEFLLNEKPFNNSDKAFYQKTNFNEYSFTHHIYLYLKYFMEGLDSSNQLLTVGSNLNRLCFIDKDGLMFDKEKEVIEIAFFKPDTGLEILNVQCDETKVHGRDFNYYQIEEYNFNKDEIANNLKPIALCSTVVEIPKEFHKHNDLIFLEVNKIKNFKKIMPLNKLSKNSRVLRGKSGYLYSAIYDKLKLYFKDCLCLMGRSIGFSDNIFKNYKNMKNIWHTNYLNYSEQTDQKVILSDNLDETEESIYYESSYVNKKVNINQDERDIVISSIVLDEIFKNISYFTRGSPCSILKLCEDFWNGKSIEPLRNENIQKLNSLIQQWQSSNIQPIAFSYKPTKIEIIEIIEKFNMDLNISDKNILNLLKNNSLQQIFLGIMAVKNNLKKSFQDLLETLNEAGIIFVFFSKEDLKNTKKLADIVLCEYDFNQCISLKPEEDQIKSENKKEKVNNKGYNIELNNIELQMTNIENRSNMLNQEGNKYLPTGVKEIKEFLDKKDEVPLQINLFSDSTINNVVDILEIYQKYGEITGCIASTLNSENIPALAISDINLGINIKPSYSCKTCNGMRKDFLNIKKPTIFEYLSMKVNSIFCSLVIDENTNYSSITNILSNARFLNFRIKLILKFYVHLIYYIILLQLPSYLIMSSPIINNYSIIFILFFTFPIILIAMLTVKKSFEHMNVLKASIRIKEKLYENEWKYSKMIIRNLINFIIIGSNITVLNTIYFIKLNEYANYVSNHYYIKNTNDNRTMNLSVYLFKSFWNFSYVPSFIDLYSTINQDRNNSSVYEIETGEKLDLTNFIMLNLDYLETIIFYFVIWFITCLSFHYVDKLKSIFSLFFFKNYKFIILSNINLIFASAIFLSRYYILKKNNKKLINFGYENVLIISISIIFIFIFDQLKKIYWNKLTSDKQKKIKLIIETRLGTYSPK